MKQLVNLFDLRGLKIWVLILGFSLNVLLSLSLFIGLTGWMAHSWDQIERAEVFLILGEFLIGYLVGFGVTLAAKDRHGPSYGVLGAMGSFFLVIFFMTPVSILVLIVAVSALLGGYHGGILGEKLLASCQ